MRVRSPSPTLRQTDLAGLRVEGEPDYGFMDHVALRFPGCLSQILPTNRKVAGNMNKWVKWKWLRALKSGEYGKGTGQLAKNPDTADGRYCCLGVLAAEMVPEFCHVNTFDCMTVGDENAKESYLPDDLATLWGLDKTTQEQLGRLNDANSDFAPVIAYIETNL